MSNPHVEQVHGNNYARGHRPAKRGPAKHQVVCPYCREADEVIPILYGFPSHEAFKKADRGEVYLGGLDISPYSYYCKRDDREF